ncbi:hypothetical protein CN450_11995 [Bacillus cereus]|nr:hypothetical protein CN450_11995 [Bacillus cereus]
MGLPANSGIKNNKEKANKWGLLTNGYVVKNLFLQLSITERPDTTAHHILDGRIAFVVQQEILKTS